MLPAFSCTAENFFLLLSKKLKEKSPLKCVMVQEISAMDPFIIRHNPKYEIQRTQVALQCLILNRLHDDVTKTGLKLITKLIKKCGFHKKIRGLNLMNVHDEHNETYENL